jgi:2-amino-4-hydroxy-6-hydroxymethyldihydropteridine diphosphokinase
MKKVTVYLGVGSNLGDRRSNLDQAVNFLMANLKIGRISPVYDTMPVGNTDQPHFLNIACEGKTSLLPEKLLEFIKGIEAEMGRKPGPRNSPRLIDIDILFYNGLVLETPSLVIPHPRLAERAFVLAPLSDIAPRLRHPLTGKTILRMLSELQREAGDAIVIK